MLKVCYILPFYEEGTDTHFFYNYMLIRRLKERGNTDILVIVEKEQRFKWPPLRFFELFLKCLKARRNVGYKNFYIHYSYYGALAAWLAGGRVFYWNRGMPWLFKRGWFEEQVFKFILRHTILVTGPELLAKEYVKRYGVKHYRILSNWVDVERFRLVEPRAQVLPRHAYSPAGELLCSRCRAAQGLAKLVPEALDKCVVLFIHHLSKRKGADLVLEIAKGFADQPVEFRIIGDGPEMDNLKLEIKNWKLENKVKLLGHVPNKEIVQYLQASSVFIMPSREEGSPHVLLEAMASGVPFVASDVGGVRELVSKELEQFLCKSEDVQCFQEHIKTLLSDKELYDKARAECLKHAKNFDISRGAEEFINLFK